MATKIQNICDLTLHRHVHFNRYILYTVLKLISINQKDKYVCKTMTTQVIIEVKKTNMAVKCKMFQIGN